MLQGSQIRLPTPTRGYFGNAFPLYDRGWFITPWGRQNTACKKAINPIGLMAFLFLNKA
jgi:hypothetical protein